MCKRSFYQPLVFGETPAWMLWQAMARWKNSTQHQSVTYEKEVTCSKCTRTGSSISQNMVIATSTQMKISLTFCPLKYIQSLVTKSSPRRHLTKRIARKNLLSGRVSPSMSINQWMLLFTTHVLWYCVIIFLVGANEFPLWRICRMNDIPTRGCITRLCLITKCFRYDDMSKSLIF